MSLSVQYDNDDERITAKRYAELTGGKGLACVNCGCRQMYTVATEPLASGVIRRRKVCRHCGTRKVTIEEDRNW